MNENTYFVNLSGPMKALRGHKCKIQKITNETIFYCTIHWRQTGAANNIAKLFLNHKTTTQENPTDLFHLAKKSPTTLNN